MIGHESDTAERITALVTQPTTARANNPQAAAQERLPLASGSVQASAFNLAAQGSFMLLPETWKHAAAWFVSVARVTLANALLRCEGIVPPPGKPAEATTDCDLTQFDANLSPQAFALIEAINQACTADSSREVIDGILAATTPPASPFKYHKAERPNRLSPEQSAENTQNRIADALRSVIRSDAFNVLSANGRAAGATPMARLQAPQRRGAIVIQDDDMPLDLGDD